MIRKIISGGQTGVDRAALDFAIEHNLKVGGWCPKGRLAEDGPIPDKYPLVETNTAMYEQRTVRNVVDSDGTLVISNGNPTGGTAMTIEAAYELRKPFFLLNLKRGFKEKEIHDWLEKERILNLNVAGQRESESPGIYNEALGILSALFLPVSQSRAQ